MRIADRDATSEDAQSGLFYNYMRGMTGVIQKVYTAQEAAIEIDTDTMPENIAIRNHEVQEQMRTKWLDSLSEEGRNRLTDQEREFKLRYVALVSTKDLIPIAAEQETVKSIKSDTDGIPPHRVTSTELDAAEQAELQRRKQTS